MMGFLEATGVWKVFAQPDRDVVAIRDVDLLVERGEFVAVTGTSGSGKSTLLSLLAGMDRPTRGSILFRGEALDSASSETLARIRREQMGFVFQDFRLIRHLTVFENVRLPLLFGGPDANGDLATRLLDRVNMSHRTGHRPDSLSRGEMQRVALARALVNGPQILFADEPTANLDRENAEGLWATLQDLHRSQGLAVLAATHDALILPSGVRVVELDNGSIASCGTH